MAASIWSLRPLDRPVHRRHFTDPERPEWEGLDLSIAEMDGPRATRYAILKADLTRKHVTGVRNAAGELTEKPEPVRCQDFSRRTPDELVIDRYAKLAAMWAGEEPCPPLSEAVGWQALLYVGWLEIANWIEEIYTKGLMGTEAPAEQEQDQGNSPGPPIAASSDASSSDTASTPKLPSAETPSSAPSNGGSGPLPPDLEPAAAISGRASAVPATRTKPWPD